MPVILPATSLNTWRVVIHEEERILVLGADTVIS